MPQLRFLLDTNVAIPMEPTSPGDIGVNATDAAALHQACTRAGISLFLHPASQADLARDRDEARRQYRQGLFAKYAELQDAPTISDDTKRVLGDPPQASNDWVDHCLIEAAARSCAHFLVTEDLGIHRKARRLGLTNIVSIKAALGVVHRLFDRETDPPPAVEHTFVYNLDHHDPIFDSFRDDYEGFDAWLSKCSKAHRKAWVIRRDGKLAGVAIYKREDGTEISENGPVLKLCSFKVADDYRGKGYGELLMRSAYDFARENDLKWIYLTAFEEKQPHLLTFLEDLGFERLDEKKDGKELIYTKPVGRHGELADLSDPAEFLRRYGPFEFKRATATPYLVPIKPEFHRVLFPDAEDEADLFPGELYYGNVLRKAYLCNANLRKIVPGDLLFFYQSKGTADVRVVGAVEQVHVSSDPGEIAGFVGKRTVYTFAEIEELSRRSEVLILLFMTLKVKGLALSLDEMKRRGVAKSHPQSIQSLPKEELPWLLSQLSL